MEQVIENQIREVANECLDEIRRVEKSSQIDGACMESVNWNVMPKAILSIFILHYIWHPTNPYKYKYKFDG